MEKACEACGGGGVAHTLRHAVKRLPRVLVLHLKRFKVGVGVLGVPVRPCKPRQGHLSCRTCCLLVCCAVLAGQRAPGSPHASRRAAPCAPAATDRY